jgi:hypothetical protein
MFHAEHKALQTRPSSDSTAIQLYISIYTWYIEVIVQASFSIRLNYELLCRRNKNETIASEMGLIHTNSTKETIRLVNCLFCWPSIERDLEGLTFIFLIEKFLFVLEPVFPSPTLHTAVTGYSLDAMQCSALLHILFCTIFYLNIARNMQTKFNICDIPVIVLYRTEWKFLTSTYKVTNFTHDKMSLIIILTLLRGLHKLCPCCCI